MFANARGNNIIRLLQAAGMETVTQDATPMSQLQEIDAIVPQRL